MSTNNDRPIQHANHPSCVDCVHYRYDDRDIPASAHRCTRPVKDIITGRLSTKDIGCDIERYGSDTPDTTYLCGIEGKYFVQKETITAKRWCLIPGPHTLDCSCSEDDLRQQIDADYPSWICDACGRKHGTPHSGCATYHNGDPNEPTDCCGWCGSKVSLTEPRDFGYPKAPHIK